MEVRTINKNVLKGYIAMAMNHAGYKTKEVADVLDCADRLDVITESEAASYYEHQKYKEESENKN